MGRKKEGKGEDCEKQNKKKDVTVYYASYGAVDVSGVFDLYKRSESVSMACSLKQQISEMLYN